MQEIITNIFNDLIENNDKFQTIQLSDIAKEIVTGKTPSTSKAEYWNGRIPFEEKMQKLTAELSEQLKEEEALNKELKKVLGAIGYEI